MKKLAVCIPNYNRPQKLERLLKALAEQIIAENLSDVVEICVSDDCSLEPPNEVVEQARMQYRSISISFNESEENMGMDYNFLRCVMMAQSEYCWIIGNDDLPAEGALKEILKYSDDSVIDMLVCPFDVYDENEVVQASVELLYGAAKEPLYFNTKNEEEYHKLMDSVRDGNAIFCFLSNVVFKKSNWVQHENLFADKMNTIFIQMYMNLKTLKDGALYVYTPFRFIKNFEDKITNAEIRREYDVLIGLSGVMDYFFTGMEHEEMTRRIIDPRINGRMWDLPDEMLVKQKIRQIDSKKNDLYRTYFIPTSEREHFFDGKNILLYGAGNLGQTALKELRRYHLRGLRIFDKDENKWGKCIEGYEIEPVAALPGEYFREESIVVVANGNSLVEMIELLHENRIANIAIIT